MRLMQIECPRSVLVRGTSSSVNDFCHSKCALLAQKPGLDVCCALCHQTRRDAVKEVPSHF